MKNTALFVAVSFLSLFVVSFVIPEVYGEMSGTERIQASEDSLPPEIVRITSTGGTTVEVEFDEELDESTATDVTNHGFSL